MIKVLIVDDQELFRESLGIILQSSGDIDVYAAWMMLCRVLRKINRM